jgi:NADH-quinone oxidoreductase subunit H
MDQYLLSLTGNPILAYLVMAVLPLLVILPYVIVALYIELKMSAHMQDRLGPMRTGKWHGVGQPFADMLKLLQKEDIIPRAADKKLFIFAPYLVFIGAYAAFAAIPISSEYIGAPINVGVFYVIAVSALVVIAILMGGWASNNKWSMLGAMRSAAQIISYEIPTAMCILVAVMITGTMDLQKINHLQEGGIVNWIVFKTPPFAFIAFFLYFVGSLAEVNRTPFDIPEADSELVAGYQTEYSGMKFAMFYLAEYTNMFAVSAIASALFLGGWTSPFGSFMSGPIWGVFWFVAKALGLVLIQMWLRWTLPRVRVDQLMYICWKVLVPFAFINVLAVGLALVLK